jgi:hypothetical protein
MILNRSLLAKQNKKKYEFRIDDLLRVKISEKRIFKEIEKLL